MSRRPSQAIAVTAVLLAGLALGAYLYTLDEPAPTGDAHDHAEEGRDAHAAEETGKHAHEEGAEAAEIRLSDAQLAQNDIEILVAGPARIRSTLSLIGEIRFNEDRLVHVVPRLAGVVQTVAANMGDRVRKDQLLATISSQALSDQRSELLAAQKRLGLAQASHARERKLWQAQISAEQDYLQAQATLREAEIAVDNATQKLASLGGARWQGRDLTRYDLVAPIDGIVIEKHLSLGEAVKDDASVIVIADLSTVWAEMTIYAKDLNAVRVGQMATVKATAFESSSSGEVSYVGPLIGEQTRTARARLVLRNPEGIWRPGLPVNVELTASETEVPVAVSDAALQTFDDATVVFVRDGERFVPRAVRTGRSDGALVEILDGLAPGERYAARNSFLVKAELGKAGTSHEH